MTVVTVSLSPVHRGHTGGSVLDLSLSPGDHPVTPHLGPLRLPELLSGGHHLGPGLLDQAEDDVVPLPDVLRLPEDQIVLVV